MLQGFDILFSIIAQEGGHSDPGVVVQDCLQVCSNILEGSEMCQRLFYSMGASWRLTLLGFVDSEQLESSSSAFVDVNDEYGGQPIAWFEQPNRLKCALLALMALVNSLGDAPPAKHQHIIAKEISGGVINAAAHWCALNGPKELLPMCLNLIRLVLKNNSDVLRIISENQIILSGIKKGSSIPSGVDLPLLLFGARTGGRAEKQVILLLPLLVERYVLADGVNCWSAAQPEDGPSTSVNLSDQYLRAIDEYLSVDETATGMILQYILAPPPPSPDDDAFGGEVDSGRPVGAVLLQLLAEACQRIMTAISNSIAVPPQASDLRQAVKCANVLTLILIRGGVLARELSTALNLGHASVSASPAMGAASAGNPSLLPYLLTVISRVWRMPSGSGYALSTCLLRLVSAAVAGCYSACRQVEENTRCDIFINTNFFSAGARKPIQFVPS